MHTEHSFLPLLLIAALAFVVPIVVARLRWFQAPAVVLELVCGIAVGRSGLNLVQESEVLGFLSLFGFVYLMFLAGLEIDFRRLKVQWGARAEDGLFANAFFQAGSIFAGTAALSIAAAWALTSSGLVEADSLLLLGLIFGTTSVGAVVPTLKERGEIGSPFGQVLLLAAIVADVVTIVALTVVLILQTQGVSWELLVVAVMFLAIYLAVKIGHTLNERGHLARLFGGVISASTHIKVRGSLALLLVFVALAEVIGVEIVLGAFLAGALVSIFTPRAHDLLTHKLEALGYGFFVPLFFIMVGVRFDLSVLTGGWQTLGMLVGLVAAAYTVKIIPSLVALGPRFGRRRAFAGGILLSSRLTLIIAISAVALSLGLISDAMNSAVILLAIITCTISPAMYVRMTPRRVRHQQRVVVAGAGRVGRELIRRLGEQGVPVVVIEQDPWQLHKLGDLEVATVLGDVTDPKTLREARLTEDDVFVAVTGDDQKNLEACMAARDTAAVCKVIARDNNPDSTVLFSQAGVIPLDLTGALAVTLENIILRPDLVHLLMHESPDHEAFELTVHRLPDGVRRVMDIGRMDDTRLILIRREEDVVVPVGTTELCLADRIVAFGPESDRQWLTDLFGGERS
jgi:Kef-type K+ transport system membrane component KefB/Trk K+ transport system NAD-binding subunit